MHSATSLVFLGSVCNLITIPLQGFSLTFTLIHAIHKCKFILNYKIENQAALMHRYGFFLSKTIYGPREKCSQKFQLIFLAISKEIDEQTDRRTGKETSFYFRVRM